MQPASRSGPFTLTLTLRGPEYAVVLPRGDTRALLDVCRTLAQVWNGAGTLLIPVEEDGSIVTSLVPELAILRPDQVLVHPAVSEQARDAAANRWPRTAMWSDSVFERQVHSWWLVRDSNAHDVPLPMPAPATPGEELVASVLWGYVNPEDVDQIRKQFAPQPVTAEELLITQVEAQVTGLSPLAWGSRCMSFTRSVNGPSWRTLYVLPQEPGFDDLVSFWNLRARYPAMPGGSLFIGLPVDALAYQERISAAINRWITQPPQGTKPDLAVDTHEKDVEQVHAALQAAGLTLVETGSWTTFRQLPTDRIAPEYALYHTILPMELERGLTTDALVGLHEGVNPVRLPIPTDFPTRLSWNGLVTAVVGGLPLTFPMSDILAQAWLTPAVAQGDRLRYAVSHVREHVPCDLRWPAAQEQMSKHMASAGLRAETSSAGRMAETFLGRIEDRSALDPLALPHGLDILEALVTRRSKRIAQHIRRELQEAGLAEIDEEVVIEALRREGLFAELEAKTLVQLQGSVSAAPGPILQTLSRLCESGYVQRGRRLRCPLCDTPDFRRLAELDDRLTCRACLQPFALPAIEDDHEPPPAYRLDAFVARIMSQDIVPVLLTLRYFLNRHADQAVGHWWPGLDLFENESDTNDHEIDLLYAEQGTVWVCEVKRNAAGMPLEQAEELCRLAGRLRAIPVLSAPAGDWADEIRALVEKENALLLGGIVKCCGLAAMR